MRRPRPASPPRAGLALALLSAVLLLPLASAVGRTPPVSAAGPVMATTDAIRGPARGTPYRVVRVAETVGSARPVEVRAYAIEVYRLAALVGIDPAIVVAQAAVETGRWTSAAWRDHLNPAGIGITGTGSTSPTWSSGTHAARGHLVHLYLYAAGEIVADHVLAPYTPLDPRYDAAVQAGYAGIADTIADLTGRWATDRWYADKIAGRGNDLFLRYRIVAVGRSPHTTSAWLADDANATTAWATTLATPPVSASLWFDLGAAKPLGTIRWLFAEMRYADRFQVQVSNDRTSWTTLGTFGNAGDPSWQALATTVSARYVRFDFANPSADPKLGSLAEVQLWPPVGATLPWQVSTPAATATSTLPPTATSAPPTATPFPFPTEPPVPTATEPETPSLPSPEPPASPGA